MGYEPYDAEREAGEEALYQSMYDEVGPQWAEDHAQELLDSSYDAAVGQFVQERLRSYYEAHPDVARAALDSLQYARSLSATHPRAACLFASIAVELAWRDVLLLPMLAGLVTLDRFAALVMEAAKTEFNRVAGLLQALLAHSTGRDLKSIRRPGSLRTVKDEIGVVSKLRNDIAHRGADATPSDASVALALADYLLNDVYPEVRRVLVVR